MEAIERAQRCAEIMMKKDASARALGLSIEIPEVGSAIASITVRAEMMNGFDVCHGGLLFTLADTAFAFACNAYNIESLSAEARIVWHKTTHVGDRLVATATEDRREGRHGYYSVVIHNQDDAVVAEFHGHSISLEKPLFAEV